MEFLSDVILGNATVNGVLSAPNAAPATVDTDSFLVLDAGVVKKRTGAQTLGDIGGEPVFTKGNVVQQTGMVITGTASGRLVGSGDLNIAFDTAFGDARYMFNLGSLASISINSNLATGTYLTQSNSPTTGTFPAGVTANNGHILIVRKAFDTNAVHQMMQINTGEIATRFSGDNAVTWGTWRKLWDSVNLPSPTSTAVGIVNTLPKYTSTSALGNSNISDTGSLVTITGNSYITANLTLGQAASALQSGGTGITIYGSSFSEIKLLNSTTGQTSTDGSAIVASGLNLVINNRENGTTSIWTNNTERLIVAAGGAVGINTQPSTMLDVRRLEAVNRTTYTDILTIDAAANTNPYSGHGGGILFRGTTYTSSAGTSRTWGRIGMVLTDLAGVTTGENMIFDVAASDSSDVLTRAMTIRYDGNIGIGVTNPINSLQISRASGQSGVQITNGTYGATITDGLFVGIDNSNAYLWNYENIPLLIATNGVQRLSISAAGLSTFTGDVITSSTTASTSTITGALRSAGGLGVAGAGWFGEAVTASSFRDAIGPYNVNLGGVAGRGLVAGYSGSNYSGIGYNIQHTATTSTWIAPGTDTVSYLAFANGLQFFYGASGAASRTLTPGSGITQVFGVSSVGNVNASGTITASIVALGSTATTFLTHIGGLIQSRTATEVRADIGAGTVTSVGGTGTVSGLTLSGTVTSSGNLTLGGALTVTAANFTSQAANTFLAAPNGLAGVPTFRGIAVADIPTLNQDTTGTAGRLTSVDLRTISPSSHTAGRLTFGFTSWANNNTSPYADFLHLRSFTDATGGLDNIVMFSKSGIGMRIWQQTWGSATAYSSYVDVLHSSNFNSYAPTLTGVGASGTNWNISVLGGAANLTTARNINNVSFNGTTNIIVPTIFNSTYSRITNPVGGEFTTSTASVTGAIRITLPRAMTGAMLRFTVKIYEYATNEAFEVNVGGYPYSVGNTWANQPFAYIVGNPNTDRRFTVRFGFDGTNAVVYIGELASTWAYPQVFVTDFQRGYADASSAWTSGWAIGFEPTAFLNVTASVLNSQVGFQTSTNAANAVVLRDGSGNFAAGTITAALNGNASTATLAANSTLWNGLAIALATYTSGTVSSFLIYNSTNARAEFGTWAQAQTWLGLGSMAYAATTSYVAKAGDSMSGALTMGYNNHINWGASPFRFRISQSSAGMLPVNIDSEYDNAAASVVFRMRTAGTPITAITILGTGRTGFGVVPNNAQLEVVASSGEVFRADAAAGAFRIVANQTGVNTQGVFSHTGNANFSGGINQGAGTLNFNANFYTVGAVPSYVQITNGSTGSSSANGLLLGLDGTGNAYVNQQSNFDLYLRTNNTTRLTIAASGAITASSSVTAASFIRTGSGSSDLLVGNGSIVGMSTASTANTVALRDGNGYIRAVYFYDDNASIGSSGITSIYGGNGDRYMYKYNQTSVRAFLDLGSNAYNSTAFLPLAGGTMTGHLNMGVWNISNATTVSGVYAEFNNISGGASGYFQANGNATYGLQALGASGSSRTIFLAGQTAYSNGFTVSYNHSTPAMVYTMNNGDLTISGRISAVVDGVGADTASYGTIGVTRTSSASILTYFAMTRSASTIWGLGIGPSNEFVIGVPSAGTQVLSNLMSISAGSTNILTIKNGVNITSGDIYLLDNSGYGILSANGTRAIAITNTAITMNRVTTVTSSITANSFIKSGGTSAQFLLADGSVTTLSSMGLESGLYTPTVTSVSNIDSTYLRTASYTKINEIVTIHINLDIDCNTTGNQVIFSCTLPYNINSAYTQEILTGVLSWYNGYSGTQGVGIISHLVSSSSTTVMGSFIASEHTTSTNVSIILQYRCAT